MFALRRANLGAVAASVGVGLVAACSSAPAEVTPTPTGQPDPAPVVPVLERVAAIPATQQTAHAVAGDVLAVAWPGVDGTDGRVVGYRLPGGEQLWERPLAALRVNDVFTAGERILVNAREEVDCPAGGEPPCWSTRVTAYAAGDGEQLWKEDHRARRVAGDPDVVLIAYSTDPDDFNSDFVHQGLRAATGEVIWTQLVSRQSQESSYYSEQPDDVLAVTDTDLLPRRASPVSSVVILRSDGTLDVVDPSTGESGSLEPTDGEQRFAIGARMTAPVAGLVMTSDEETLIAYSLTTLREQWRLPIGAQFDGVMASNVDCGQAVCLELFASDRSGETRVVDIETGEVRFAQAWDGTMPYRTGLALPDHPTGPLLTYAWGRAVGPGGEAPEDLARQCEEHHGQMYGCDLAGVAPRVMSPESGEVLLDLARWRVVGASQQWLLLVSGPDGPVALDGGEAAFAVADLADLRLHEVGALPELAVDAQDAADSCRVSGPWLTCLHADDTLGVWNFRS